jgi:hypothetical protein
MASKKRGSPESGVEDFGKRRSREMKKRKLIIRIGTLVLSMGLLAGF